MDEKQATHVDAQRNQASKNHSDQYKGQYPIKVNKLQHLFYEMSEAEKTAKFFSQAMVFEETDNDETGMIFYKCGKVHHAIGLRPGKACQRPENVEAPNVEHLDLEVDIMDIDLRSCDFLKKNEISFALQGRNGAEGRAAQYFYDSDGCEFELYFGMDRIGGNTKLRPLRQFHRIASLEGARDKTHTEKW